MLFSFYTCSITFFTHTHIIGGVTIVHSHFYKTDAEGNPTHEHTGAEIQLIHTLSSFYTFGFIVLFILIALTYPWVKKLSLRPFHYPNTHFYLHALSLRGPPAL